MIFLGFSSLYIYFSCPLEFDPSIPKWMSIPSLSFSELEALCVSSIYLHSMAILIGSGSHQTSAITMCRQPEFVRPSLLNKFHTFKTNPI
jgi:hypothetical protein